MKRRISMLLAGVMLVCSVLAPFGTMKEARAVSPAKLQKTAYVIDIGAIKVTSPKINILNKKKTAKYTFTTSNKKVASVSTAGTVKAVKTGKASITVRETYKNKTKKIGSCSITVKETIAKDFVQKASLSRIMEKIYDGVEMQLPMLENIKITTESSGYFLGIKNMEFKEAIASEAMMTSIAYSMCLVRVKDGSDVEKVKAEIKENVNPRKWVCVSVEPENVRVESIGNVILLVMTNEGSQELADSFMRLDMSETKEHAQEKARQKLISYNGYYSFPMDDYDSKSAANVGKKITWITNKYLKNVKSVSYSIIPDKTYFMKNSYFTKGDYDKLFSTMKKNVKGAKYISIVNTLRLSDYYKTDLHWRQESILDTVNALGKKMNFSVSSRNYDTKTKNNYKGIYAPHISGKVPNESLKYLVSSNTKKADVKIYGQSGTSDVYNTKKLSSKVPYDVFLSGPNPIVTITVPGSKSKRELVIFGDSFASSMAPLLLETYKKVTLVDLRFVSSKYLSNFVSFHKSQEVLFLYNTSIVNRSYMLK